MLVLLQQLNSDPVNFSVKLASWQNGEWARTHMRFPNSFTGRDFAVEPPGSPIILHLEPLVTWASSMTHCSALKPHLLMNLQRTEWRYSTHVRCTRWPKEHRQSPRSSSNEWTDQARSHPTYNVCFSTVECYCQWSEPRVWPTKKRGGAVWNKLKQIYRTLSFSPQTRRCTKGWFNLHIEIGDGFSWWVGKRGRWTVDNC